MIVIEPVKDMQDVHHFLYRMHQDVSREITALSAQEVYTIVCKQLPYWLMYSCKWLMVSCCISIVSFTTSLMEIISL